MTKTTVTVPCDRCEGVGVVPNPVRDEPLGNVTCPSCQGQCHVEITLLPNRMVPPRSTMPLTPEEAFIYVCAVRYAINRQTYAGGIVVQELQKVIHRMPYSDRKLLEKEIADALFKGEVDSVHRAQWEAIVDQLRNTP